MLLELSPSPALAAAVISAHAAAGASVLAILPDGRGAALAACLVGLGAAAAWRRALLRGREAVRAIRITGAETGELWLADGERIAVSFARERRVARNWVTLTAKRPARRTLLVTAGMLDRAAFRALRLWALWGNAPGAFQSVASGQLLR